MLKVTNTFVRPSSAVPFYTVTEEWRTYSIATYGNTGDRVSINFEWTNDKLTFRLVTVWKDRATFDRYQNDPVTIQKYLNPRQAYNQENGIVSSGAVFAEV